MSISFQPMTDVVYDRLSNDKTQFVRYYGSLQMEQRVVVNHGDDPRRRGGTGGGSSRSVVGECRKQDKIAASHRWTVGDLVVFKAEGRTRSLSASCAAGLQSLVATDPDVRVGQILALSLTHKRSADGAGSSGPAASAKVRHLLPWEAARRVLRDGEQKQVRSHCRGKQMYGLLETFVTSRIALLCIDPAVSVRIDPESASSSFSNNGLINKLMPESGASGSSEPSYSWVFEQVYGARDAGGQLTLFGSAKNDWSNGGNTIVHSNVNPIPLRRGWSCLRGSALRDALRLKLLASLIPLRNLPLCPDAADDPTLVDPIPEELDESANSDDEEASVWLFDPSSVDGSSGPQPPASGSKRPAGGRNPTPPSIQAPAKRRRDGTIRGKNRDPPSQAKAKPANAEGHAAPEDETVQVQPLSAPFVLRTGKSVHVQPPPRFYTHAQIVTSGASLRRFGKKSPMRWTVSIGDVVVVATAGSGAGDIATPSRKLKSSSRDPFEVPWCVAQVLSIYQKHERDSKPREGRNVTRGESSRDALGREGSLWMELRLFYRPEELQNLEVACPEAHDLEFSLVEVDELVSVAPVQRVLGRARVTSNPDNKLGVSTDEDGVTTVTFLCQYIFMQQFDEHSVRPIQDWDTHFGLRLSGPLSRALLCEKAWPGRRGATRLQKVYTQFLIQRFNLQDTMLASGVVEHAWPSDEETVFSHSTSCNIRRTVWPKGLLEHVDVTDTQTQRTIGVYKGREFLPDVLIPTWLKRYDARATSNKSITFPPWKLSLGDCICLADASSDRVPKLTKESRNPWFPFQGPWRIVQVLSIYREPAIENKGSSVLLEVRRFFCRDDVPSHLHHLLPPLFDDEVFETDDVERDIPAYRVLSLCAVRAPLHTAGSTSTPQVREVRRRTRFFFLQEVQHFLPVFSNTTNGWSKSLLQRGLKCSRLIQDDADLAGAVEFRLDVPLRDQDANMLDALFASLPTDQAQPQPLISGLYRTVPLSPQWDAFYRNDLLHPIEERSGVKWTVQVGDLVAARAGLETDERGSWFPFLVAWKPCLILSMWSESSTGEAIKATVQWLPCLHSRHDNNDIPKMCEVCEGSIKPEIGVVEVSSFLGPVLLRVDKEFLSLPRSISPLLPYSIIDFVPSSKRPVDEFRRQILLEGLKVCSDYDDATRREVVRVLGFERLSSPRNESQGQTSNDNAVSSAAARKVRAVEPPVLLDTSSRTKFYSTFDVATRFDVLAQAPPKEVRDNLPRYWNAKLGDVVAVKSTARLRRKEDPSPFTVPWHVAEVVTIFASSCESETPDVGGDDSLRIEVRWFYRPLEVSDSFRGSETGPTEPRSMPELFESDSYEVLSASLLLCPVLLRDEIEAPIHPVEPLDGMPLLQFSCRQFWSQRRKALMPIGNLRARINRGRAHSYYFLKYDALQLAYQRIVQKRYPSAGLSMTETLSPENAFQRVIDKLSLTDASKEALHQSDGIIGRETERSFLTNFIVAAVGGYTQCSTLFIAGPPGAGKTACVRACINELKRRDSSSEEYVTDFDFVVVNGMELRHPYDAYARLWEEISPEKERCSADKAEKKLHTYFTSNGEPAKRRVKSTKHERALVVLIDELDYLYTKKEDVLYNLFDWPSRSIHGRRLVVIGVSNTMTLPDRLHLRFQSRIGSKQCIFKSYNINEITDILRSKVAQAAPDYKVFDDEAIALASKKTAKNSGDIRRAFRICRAAAETVLANFECSTGEGNHAATLRVRIKDVHQVSGDSYNSAQTKGLALSSTFDALFLVALASLSRWTGRERGGFDVEEILTKMHAMAKSLGDHRYLPPPTLDETLSIMARLCEAHVIGLSTSKANSASHRPGVSGSGGPWPLVSMVMEDTAILVAFKNTENRDLALKYIQQDYSSSNA